MACGWKKKYQQINVEDDLAIIVKGWAGPIKKTAANEYELVTQVVSLMEHSEDLDPDEISWCFTGNCSAKTLHLSPKTLCRLPRKGKIIFRTRTYCVDIEELVKEGIPVAARFGEYSQALALGYFRVLRMEAEKTGKTTDHTDENKHAIAISRFVSIGVKMRVKEKPLMTTNQSFKGVSLEKPVIWNDYSNQAVAWMENRRDDDSSRLSWCFTQNGPEDMFADALDTVVYRSHTSLPRYHADSLEWV
ncbi:hypothetical protein EDC04DRAFT_2991436 [Pisolithus marmoratus]|nr:hypothetical protein EDC04DRAFT_2991436 [Pisolithus marmoratus]